MLDMDEEEGEEEEEEENQKEEEEQEWKENFRINLVLISFIGSKLCTKSIKT